MTRGRTYNVVIATLQKLATKSHVSLLRATNGRLGGRMFGSPVLVLATTGRKSGKKRETPLLYLKDGDDLVLVASNGGTAAHPAWFLNLMAKPEAEVHLGGRTHPVRAEEAVGEEKRRLWERLVEMYPSYTDYQGKTDREIPVVVLHGR